MNNPSPDRLIDVERKRRIRRNVVLLVLLAVAFEVSFIVLNIPRG